MVRMVLGLVLFLAAPCLAQHNFLAEKDDDATFSLQIPVPQDCEDGLCPVPTVIKKAATTAAAPVYRLETRRRYVSRGWRGGYWQVYTVRVPVTTTSANVVCENGVCRIVP